MKARETLRLTDRFSQAEWLDSLSLGPWLWPPEDSPDLAHALKLVPSGPPGPAVGEVALVSVPRDRASGGTVSLWKLLPAHAPTGHGMVGFKPATGRLWRDFAAQLSRMVPVLWQSLPVAQHQPPHARLMAEWLFDSVHSAGANASSAASPCCPSTTSAPIRTTPSSPAASMRKC